MRQLKCLVVVLAMFGVHSYPARDSNEIWGDPSVPYYPSGSRSERSFSFLEPMLPGVEKVVNSFSQQGFTSSFKCFVCQIGVKLLLHMVNSGASKDRIQEVASGFCKRFKLFPNEVCDGVTNAYKGEIVEVFSRVKVSPSEICHTSFAEECGSQIYPNNNWTVALPNVPKPSVLPVLPPKPGATCLKVLHLSDIHLDLNYKVDSNAACREPLCCREGNSSNNPNNAAGKWGDYRNCDTPLVVLDNMLKRIAGFKKIDLILWTGDDPPHNVWSQEKESQIEVLETVAGMINKYFPDIPVYPALGNHEGIPVNSFPLPNTSSKTINWLYDALAKTWTRFLPNSTEATIKKGGYYSTPTFPGLRIISLNMNYCNNLNWYLFLNATDPLDELQWLIDELQNAETNNEKVFIIGHIPPGSADCLPMWSYNYYRIINRYESTIRAQFFGHTHLDEFEIFYDVDDIDRPVSVAYVGPSVTPYDAVNPSFRVYTVDGNYKDSTWAVLDHETYYFNVTEANIFGKPKWLLMYTAKNAYNMTALQPKDWDGFLYKLKVDDTLFQRFYRNLHRASDAYPACDKVCKRKLLCNLQSGQSKEYFRCAGY